MKVTSKELKSLESDNYDGLKDVIVKKLKISDQEFVVVDYRLVGANRISYSIEFKDTEEAKLIQKTIKDLRKNKEEYIRKIKQK